jgi:serpin B
MAVAVSLLTSVACGGEDESTTSAGGRMPVSYGEASRDTGSIDPVAGVQRVVSTAHPQLAGAAVSALSGDLFRAVRAGAPDENVTLSPLSIAIALATVEPGTNDAAQSQLRQLLRIEDPASFHASMNALEQDLEARVAEAPNEGDDPGELSVRIANAAYLQRDYPFRADYVDAVTAAYGPVLNQVDFSVDPDAVARQINDFVADATNDRISDLVADGIIRPETVLALVNALYLNAS